MSEFKITDFQMIAHISHKKKVAEVQSWPYKLICMVKGNRTNFKQAIKCMNHEFHFMYMKTCLLTKNAVFMSEGVSSIKL